MGKQWKDEDQYDPRNLKKKKKRIKKKEKIKNQKIKWRIEEQGGESTAKANDLKKENGKKGTAKQERIQPKGWGGKETGREKKNDGWGR